MKFRTLGRTGLRIPEIAFGCGRSGGILIDADDDTRRRAIRRTLDMGVDWFDTAAAYAQGKSEQALGWLLDEIDDTPHVSTKVMLTEDDMGDIAGAVERSMEASLTRLRRQSVDLFQLHNQITDGDGRRAISTERVLGAGGVAVATERLRGQGLCRYIGLTALGDAAATCRVLESERFDTAQIYYNMLNPSAARAMPAAWTGFDCTGVIDTCRRLNLGILAVRIFAASYLATPVRTGRESILTADTEPDSEAHKAEALFAEIGEDYGGRAATAVRFGLSNPDISTVVIGLADIAHMEEAARAVEAGPLPEDAFARLDKLYESDFGRG